MPKSTYLLLCRPGFERDALLETGLVGTPTPLSGYVFAESDLPVRFHWKQFVFARQFLPCLPARALPAADRVAALGKAMAQLGGSYAAIHCIYPDSNEGKKHAATEKALEDALLALATEQGHLDADSDNRLLVFFSDDGRFTVGLAGSDSAPWAHGFPRLRMPGEAPSRSTLKLAEAFEVFLGEREREEFLRPGMTAVDLGAAPGGWTWQFLSRGIAVDAVDNGPLKGAVATHPLVRHLRDDGFKYRPAKPVDWMVCDMVERPPRVAERIADWVERGWARHFIFNLKLPTRKHIEEVRHCLAIIEERLANAGIRYRLQARHLYHDREEITCYLRREGKAQSGKGKFRGPTSW